MTMFRTTSFKRKLPVPFFEVLDQEYAELLRTEGIESEGSLGHLASDWLTLPDLPAWRDSTATYAGRVRRR